MAGHADLFSKRRITLLWIESPVCVRTRTGRRRPSLQFSPDSPFDDSAYCVELSRLSGADWQMFLGR